MTGGLAERDTTRRGYTTAAVGSIAERIDAGRIEALRDSSLPGPVHAINYVRFQSVLLYRLYSILLLPYVLPKGVRPVWVATREETLVGSSDDDEIVIVEYPDQGALLDIFTGGYYGRINGLRERGVRHLGFSVNEPLDTGESGGREDSSLGTGSYLVVRFAGSDDALEYVLELTRPLGDLAYAARAVGDLDIFSEPSPKDPAPVRLPNILVFEDQAAGSKVSDVVEALSREGAVDCDMQRFRTVGTLEALGLRR